MVKQRIFDVMAEIITRKTLAMESVRSLYSFGETTNKSTGYK